MGLLDTDRLQRMFGRVFRPVYGDGVFIEIAKVRQSGGTMATVIRARHPVKIQIDAATQAMRAAEGAASTDMRILILRDSFAQELSAITSDSYVFGGGFLWGLNGLTTDPARSYYETRGVQRMASPLAVADILAMTDQEAIEWASR